MKHEMKHQKPEVVIDIETIPQEKLKADFLASAVDEFKAPSTLSKKKALEDMGLDGSKEPQKYWTKDDTIKEWTEKMAPVLAEDIALENWKKCSFDGAKGEICSIAFAVGDGVLHTLCRDHTETEKSLLVRFVQALVDEIGSMQPYFIGHFISGFDLKFLFQRIVINEVPVPFRIPFNGRNGSDFFDTMISWAGFKGSISQDDLCLALGIEGKPEGVDGSKVLEMWENGQFTDIAEYNADDVFKCREIYRRLKVVPV